MRAIILIMVVAVVLAASCGYLERHDEKSAPAGSELDELRALRDLKLAMLRAASDPATGWPSVDDCDGTLWAGLAAAAGAGWVRIDLAEHAPGVIHRRPTPCWTPEDGDVGSKSTVSNDMLSGYLLAIWRRADLEAARRLADYGEGHDWVMGAPFPAMATRVVMSTNLRGLLGSVIYRLSGGADSRDIRWLPPVYVAVSEDYERHLQTIGILLAGELGHGLALDVNGTLLERLKENAAAAPDDAFVQAVLARYSGDFEPPFALLLDPAYQCPTYVRGADAYCMVHWLIAAEVVLR